VEREKKDVVDHQKDKPTKPAGQDIGPPDERVDDETDSADKKTTTRQE
jgi:hypothetical protein